MPSLPSLTLNVNPYGLASLPGSTTNTFALIAPCTLFPDGVPSGTPPILIPSVTSVVGLIGHGSGAEAAAYMLQTSGGTIEFFPANWTLPVAPSQPTPSSSNGNTSPAVLAEMTESYFGSGYGAQTDNYLVQVACVQGYDPTIPGNSLANGLPGTATFTYSLDGGVTVSGQITIPITNPQTPALWLASTRYTVGQEVQNGTEIYTCTTAGKSASSGGPSGTGTGIADGSVVWSSVGPAFPWAGITAVIPSLTALTSGSTVSSAGPFNLVPAGVTGLNTQIEFDQTTTNKYTFTGTRGSMLGSSTTPSGTNGSVTLAINGVNQTFTVASSANTLTLIISSINAQLLSGVVVADGDQLLFYSDTYGTGSTVTVVSGTSATLTDLGLNSVTSTTGTSKITLNSGSATTCTIANMAAALASEIAAAVTSVATISGGTLTATSGSAGVLTATSATTGPTSSVEILNAGGLALGFTPNTIYSGSSAGTGGIINPNTNFGGAGTSPTIQLSGAVAESVTAISRLDIKVTTGGIYSAAYVAISVNGGSFGSPFAVNSNNGQWTGTGNALGLTITFNQTGTYAINDAYTFATAGSYAISEQDGTPTGVILSFPVGVYEAGDSWSFTALPPQVSSTDLNTQLQSIINQPSVQADMVIADCNPTDAGTTPGYNVEVLSTTMDSALETLAGVGSNRFSRGLVVGANALPTAANCTPANYGTALNALDLERTMTLGGQCTYTSPLTTRSYQANPGIVAAGRLMKIGLAESPAFIGRGALSGLLTSAQNLDAATALDAVRVPTTKVISGKTGFYVSDDTTLAANGSNFSMIQNGRVMDEACFLIYSTIVNNLNGQLSCNDDGTLSVTSANAINGSCNAALLNGLVTPGCATNASVVADTTNDVIETDNLIVAVTVQPFGYAKQITVNIAFGLVSS